MEEGTNAKHVGLLLFALLPESVVKKIYPKEYFGTERYPDWFI